MYNDGQYRYPEVRFPGEFRPQDPWHKKWVDFPDDTLPATIPIYRLVHITHPTQARHIEQVPNRRYKFIPKMKCGKSYNEERIGETYVHIGGEKFEEITSKDSVFPGYLSWWGIDVRGWYEDGCQLLQSISRERINGRYVPGYLAAEPESPYGSVAFSIELPDILRDYKKARNIQGARVCLKVGGTLRYRKEICYVVIVCLKDDNELGDMPSIAGPKFPQFVSSDLVDSNGFVIDHNKAPEFNATSIIKSEILGEDPTGKNMYVYDHYSWEQLVFAFYFPTRGENLVCTQVTKTDYQHFARNCQKCG
ncbi:uncharacterized protein LOC135348504 [Halichondria panicea]|uniref:uncharacterized protein LOC135348504 n=1 Tax=Halichondria panicea TaxID=6063 RepID=UPI00312B66C5